LQLIHNCSSNAIRTSPRQPPPRRSPESQGFYDAFGVPRACRFFPALGRSRPRLLCLCPALKEVSSLPPFSFSFEIFLDALLSNAQGANQKNFREIIVVETRYVLLVRTGDCFLRLHHFNGICHARAEAVARLHEGLIRQVNIATRHAYLLRRRL